MSRPAHSIQELYQKESKPADVVNKSKLTRSNNRVIAGVCAGLAVWLGWDIALVRLLYLIISIFSAGFPGILAYIILWIVMPEETDFQS
ncbi:MAG: PspC domain-containing protein [Bacteroidales bacterium]|nr:PspC domain-containing protein [Bacteroidales bacterium]